MKKTIGIITLLLFLALPFPLKGQGVSESDRLRMELINLRQINDSLSRELQFYRRNYVPDLWAGLTGMEEDKDVENDYSGFGLRAEKGPSPLQVEVSRAVPSFTLAYNPIYESFIEKYTITKRKSMPYILGRYNMYLPSFRATFAKYGVPEELIALCIVESAVSREALSSAGARGMWQLMPATARQYGLTVNETLDERLLVDKSTDAAARVLRDLKRSLGTWELAVLAYNCGSASVRRAIIKSEGKKDVWQIYDWLPSETRAYLPSLIAAAYCVRYHENYSIEARRYSLPKTETFTVSKACLLDDLAAAMAMRVSDLSSMNSQYLQGYVPEAGMAVTVPAGMGKLLKAVGY